MSVSIIWLDQQLVGDPQQHGAASQHQREHQRIPEEAVAEPARGALYLFPKLDVEKFGIEDDERFALDLLKEQKILVSHGSAFNLPTPDHFRLVFLPSVEMLATMSPMSVLPGIFTPKAATRCRPFHCAR